MGRPLADNPQRDYDHMILDQQIAAASLSGAVPCRSVPLHLSTAWTESSDEDRRAGELAAALCKGCPVIEPCRAFGDTYTDERGTYGGKSDAARRPPRGFAARTRTAVAS